MSGSLNLYVRKKPFRPAFLSLLLLFLSISNPLWAADPIIKYEPLSSNSAAKGKPFIINGKILENDDLDEVILFYRVEGETRFKSMRMTLYEGVKYKLLIPATRMKAKYLEYYIIGIDIDKKQLPLYGSLKNPIRINIIEAKEDQKTDDDTDIPTDEFNASEDTFFSAARKEQLIQKAPGVVTVITAGEIKAAGFRSFIELLRYVVGFDINGNGLSWDMGIRGVNPRMGFGDKLVVLIDGHNMAWRQLNRNYDVISIDMIKRVEIIRGPGSTLWGANALSGVINIITKANTDLKGFASTLGGSPVGRSYFVSLQGGRELLDGLTFRASFSMQRDNYSALYAPIKEFLSKGIYYVPASHIETNQFFYGVLSWHGFSLTLLQHHYNAQLPLSNFSIIGGDDTYITGNRYIAKLSWLRTLGSWGTLLLWGSYDYYGFGSGSAYEANGLVPRPSSSLLNGNSTHFGLYEIKPPKKTPEFKGYFPLCQVATPDSPLPCIVIQQKAKQRVCTLMRSPSQQQPIGEYAIPNGKNIPLKFCAPTYQGGRFTRKLKGFDHKFSAGAQVNVAFSEDFSLSVGLDFEYLDLIQVHTPDIWKLLGVETPHFQGIHASMFLQVQYNLARLVEFTLGGRFDYDQQYGFVPTPRAAVIFTPGHGLFAKLLYGNAFKAPSFFDLYYARPNETYGNPALQPESVHTFEIQLGWLKRRLISFSINGFYSKFSNLISYEIRKPDQPLAGLDKLSEEEQKRRFPKSIRPNGTKEYEQKANNASLDTYGGEFELRYFPFRGFSLRAGFGYFFGDDGKQSSPDALDPLLFAAHWSGSLQASYYKRTRSFGFLISLGALFVGPKKVPRKGLNIPGSILPYEDVDQAKTTNEACRAGKGPWHCAMPSWTAKDDPTLETPAYVNTYLSLQFLRLLGHADLILRFSNLLDLDIYDANDELLTPQRKFDFMVWLRLNY